MASEPENLVVPALFMPAPPMVCTVLGAWQPVAMEWTFAREGEREDGGDDMDVAVHVEANRMPRGSTMASLTTLLTSGAWGEEAGRSERWTGPVQGGGGGGQQC